MKSNFSEAYGLQKDWRPVHVKRDSDKDENELILRGKTIGGRIEEQNEKNEC